MPQRYEKALYLTYEMWKDLREDSFSYWLKSAKTAGDQAWVVSEFNRKHHVNSPWSVHDICFLMNLAKMPTHRDAGANEFPAYFTRFAFCDEHPRRTSDGDADAMDVDGDDVLPVEDIRRSLTATINNLRKPKPGFSQKAIGDRLDQFILDLPNNPNAPTASRPGTSAEVEIFNGIRKRGADGAYIVPHELMQRHLKCFTELAASTHGPNDGANAAYLSGNGYHSGGNNGGGRGNRGGRGNYQDGHNNNQNGGYNGNNNNNGNGNGNNGNGNNGGNNGGNGGGGGSSGRGGHRGGRGNRGN